MAASQSAFDSTVKIPSTIPVLDPYCRGGILHVPVHLTSTTKGKQDWLQAGGCLMRDLSVCCLHQQQRCRAGTSCRQIHADHAWITEARRLQAGVVTCCLSCGDTSTVAAVTSAQGPFASALRQLGLEAPVCFTGVAASGMPRVALRQLASTSGLAAFLNSAVKADARQVDIPWSAVCRLHLKDNCKYGKDCKNVHVCVKLGTDLLTTAAANANPSVNVRDLTAIRRQSTVNSGFATRAAEPSPTAAAPAPEEPRQPPAPEPFKKAFRLDEGSLLMKDPDLADLVFNMPTLQSALSNDSRCDLFGLPSPADRSALLLTCSPGTRGASMIMSPLVASPLARGTRPCC